MKKKFILLLFSGLSTTILLSQQKHLFSLLTSVQTGINFNNKLTENAEHNIITYEYFYNGGGVAAGDFNNDGLIDLYFTANLLANRLYLNKGSMKFDDITKQAGVAGRKGWKQVYLLPMLMGMGFLIFMFANQPMATQNEEEIFY